MMTDSETMEMLRNVDIRTVDPDTLANIQDVRVNADLPKQERLLDFIRQIKNPYCFLCGSTIVKISYAKTNTTMEERMEGFFRSL